MTVVETSDRTRLIFNLIELVPYTTQRNNNSLVMTIGGDSADMASDISRSDGTSPAAPSAEGSPALVDVDFRRGAQGEG
ncbi:hypothetical protein, partial [Psychrobacter sp. GW64-MNA-CIBAN-0177]|uniref:hypothetical protein n=1 Tax=Psychrobacter sp. GW64-MNA-CIBAN-0177 TaxID=3140449 RepID=UPI00387E6255